MTATITATERALEICHDYSITVTPLGWFMCQQKRAGVPIVDAAIAYKGMLHAALTKAAGEAVELAQSYVHTDLTVAAEISRDARRMVEAARELYRCDCGALIGTDSHTITDTCSRSAL